MAPILGYRSIGVGLFIALTLPLCFSPIAAWGQSDDVVPTAVDETGRTDVRAQEIDSMLSKYFAPGEP